MARRTFNKGAKIERFEKNLERPTAALKQIGAFMIEESQRAFKLQRFGKKAWPPRGEVNVFGIIADFAAGKKKPPKRRFEQRPALHDTGRLAKSVAFKLTGNRTVEVGSNLPYAGVHHKGGPVESETITEDLQEALWKWLKKQSKDLRDRLGWLLNFKWVGEKIKGKVPERPIVGITKLTRENVQEAVGVKIFEVR